MTTAMTWTEEQNSSKTVNLIERICRGEKLLFHDLIAPYERLMFAAAYSVLRHPQDAEEAVQEASLKCFLHLGQLQDRERFKGWLLRIVVNEARMHLRQIRRHRSESIDAFDPDTQSDAMPRQFADWRELPDEALEREELRAAVRNSVDELPVLYREVYLLADAQKQSNAVIAQALGVSVGVVKTRLHRARMRVQEQLHPVFRSRFSDHVRLMKGMNPWSRAGK